MYKIFISIIALITISLSQEYSIGDQISPDHQYTGFEVCYGNYPLDSLRLADFNGNLNGGNYQITFIAIQNAG